MQNGVLVDEGSQFIFEEYSSELGFLKTNYTG